MCERTIRLASAIGLASLIVFLGGCAATRQTEQMLSAAGFKMTSADTPEKLAHLKALPQYTLLTREHDGRPYFVYADAASKRLYSGDQKAYEQYQKMAFEQGVAEEESEAADEATAEGWGIWGLEPWGSR
ncbi:MAG: hypothetical protein JXQ73_09265 [Phycisphaerae bacterium]|nr:hypothetical protein [Phycisphaerae bacterium]